MADSGITKKALAGALKKLMEEMPFSKISVGDICERCDMNRKSFYYHFKDKYDLVNWVFDIEFMEVVGETECLRGWEFFRKLCEYLYDHHDFYRRALKIDGQNTFREHFREILHAFSSAELQKIFFDETVDDFYIHFITDGFVCAMERWITERNCVSPDVFLLKIETIMKKIAVRVYSRIEENSENSL